jgi:flagellar biosynthesis/type III secretory pathway M-ring protein FliF/YscJ
VRVDESLKALGQSGKPQMLLIALLCTAIALLGFALLRTNGAPVAEPAPAAIPIQSSDRQALVEARLREQTEALIGAIVGRGNVRAVVSAEIEPDQTRQVSEVGDAGPGTTQTITTRSTGQIRRLTVSVMVNGRQETGSEGTVYRPRTKAELARFTRLAQNAIGFDAMRGDSLTVESVRFAPAETQSSSDRAHTLLRAAIAFAGVFGIAALFLLVRSRLTQNLAEPAVQHPETAGPALPSSFTFSNDAVHSPALRRAGETVAGRPAAAAAVIRQWMST